MAFAVQRLNAVEWVRVLIADPGMPPPIFTAKNYVFEGSRASDRHEWYMFAYSKRGESGVLEEDKDKTSNNAPIFRKGAPSSKDDAEKKVVTLLVNADNEGFQASYTKATKKWKMTGTKTTGDVQADLVGGKWTLEIPNKVRFEITPKNAQQIAFEDGDQYDFRVFKCAAAAKTNEIKTGSKDLTGNP